MKKQSRAYFLHDGCLPPELPPGEEWYVFRLAMGLTGKGDCKKELPNPNFLMPIFTMVATDRESAVAAVTEKLHDLFDVFDRNAQYAKGIKNERKRNHSRT